MSALPRLLLGASAAGMTLSDHLETHGPAPPSEPGALIAEVEHAGLRGRGGAGFPTAVKMAAVAGAGDPSVVLANGAEGEPAGLKDCALLAANPHLVLDGALLAAGEVGASHVILAVRQSATTAIAAATRALGERTREARRVRVVTTPDAYLAGEESALVRYLNGGPLKPTFVPPRPFERGVARRPTLVQNVETLAHLALIARHGAGWFRQAGTEREPGSVLVTLTGAVAKPGVYEIDARTRLQGLLDAAGGATEEVRALLLGGYFGSWIDGRELARPAGNVGSGVIVVLPASACGVAESARALAYMAAESAGQCGPCLNGLHAIAEGVGRLANGTAPPTIDDDLARWGVIVPGRGACHHPNGAVRLAHSALHVFADEFAAHRRNGPCRRCRATPVLPTGRPERLAA